MTDMYEGVFMAPFSILFGFLSLVVPVAVIGLVVYFIVRRRNGGMGITAYHVLLGYFYMVIAATVFTMAVGVGYLVFSILSQVYRANLPVDDEVALGLTLLVTGGAICALHVLGTRAVQKRAEKANAILKRIYLFSMLALFSLSGLVALPTAIYEAIQYHLGSTAQATAPAGSLATAAVTVPLWGYYLWRVLREMRGSAEAVSVRASQQEHRPRAQAGTLVALMCLLDLGDARSRGALRPAPLHRTLA